MDHQQEARISGQFSFYWHPSFRTFCHIRADFKLLVNTSSSFRPSSGDFASPSTLTMALPTITPSAPQSATCKQVRYQHPMPKYVLYQQQECTPGA